MSSEKDSLQLLSADRTARIISRMAHQIMEDNTDNRFVFLCGIDERGIALARLLEKELATFECRVDIALLSIKKDAASPDLSKVEESFCVIVDDVIFSGNTMFKALSLVCATHQPSVIKIAALIDRGHRKFPLQADYTGITSPTKLNEHVRCLFHDNGSTTAVLIRQNNNI